MDMRNAVPARLPPGSVAERTLLRSLGARQALYAGEVRRLIDAAFRVMRETGSLDPRVEQIVRAAGLSNQAFYRHFRSKGELLLAVLDDGIGQLCAYLGKRMAGADSGEARVREWLAGMLAQALHPAGAASTRPFALARARLAEQFPGAEAEALLAFAMGGLRRGA
jgi:AcrR family transcriptional regulator